MMSGVALSVTDYVRHQWPISVPDHMPGKCLYLYLVASAVIMQLVTFTFNFSHFMVLTPGGVLTVVKIFFYKKTLKNYITIIQ